VGSKSTTADLRWKQKEKCTGKNKQEQNNSKSSRLACIEENILRDNNLVKYQALLQQQFGPNWTEPSKYE
jgi:hypothetical protein